MRIFLSYSWRDEALRKSIYHVIGSLPLVEVIYDSARIKVGDSIHPGVSELIDAADLVVAIVTPHSLNSQEVADELARASERAKTIIPFVSDEAGQVPLPYYFLDKLQLRFKSGELDEKIEKLKQVVGSYVEVNHSRQYTSWTKGSTVFRPAILDSNELQRLDLGGELLEQVLVYCHVLDFSFFDTGGAPKSVPLFICPNVFVPDDWTRALLLGTIRSGALDASPLRILDVGAGTAAVPIALNKLDGTKIQKLTTVDIDTLACEVARINLNYHELGSRSFIISGMDIAAARRRELIEPAELFDLIVANLPQVPTTSQRQIRDYFDYYGLPLGESGEWDYWARCGLWLIAKTLSEIRPHISNGGQAIFVLSGRPTRGHLENMFKKLKYEFQVVYEACVEQDPGTDIGSLVAFEQLAAQFEFFSDAGCTARISARDAHRLMLGGDQVYQKLYVISAKPAAT
jgi:methylase of polypeptide subunit release factors